MTLISGRQPQPTSGRRGGQPASHQAVNLGVACFRVLSAHPLPVELNSELVHLQCGPHTLGLGRPFKRTPPRSSPPFGEAREQSPESAHPLHALIIPEVDEIEPSPTASMTRRRA
jgi:hypothetical protein